MRRALLVIDMLVDFVAPQGALPVPAAAGIVSRVAEELGDARARGDVVVFLCDAHRPDDPEFTRMGWPPHAVRGTPGAGVVRELEPHPGEVLVEKTTYSGFHGTRLGAQLEEKAVDTLRLTGCVTNICVYFTAADAAMLGYTVEVVADAVAGLSPADHAYALRQMREVLGVKLVAREG